MSFMIDLGKGTRVRFGTRKEAEAFVEDLYRDDGIIYCIFEDERNKADMWYRFNEIEVAGKTYKRGAYYL